MILKGKMVWDLSLDEIEYVYRNRHMNHYVYAALKTYYTSSPPINRSVSLRSNTIPPYLRSPFEKLVELSRYIGKYDPSFVRASITFNTYIIYSMLELVQLENISLVTQLLAACAYLPIISEKNDNLPLWNKKVVRDETKSIKAIIDKLLEPVIDIEEVSMMPLFGDEGNEKMSPGDLFNIFRFMPRAIYSLIVFMENGEDPQLIERALLNSERAMREYERDNGHSSTSSIKVRSPGQLRYRNTIYLYGGMFFEKQKMYDRAIDWYLKDIDDSELPDTSFGFFLTDMKTTERLISAYPLITDKKIKSNLKDTIHRCLVRIAKGATQHSHTILDFLKLHPSTDLRSESLYSKGKRMLYAGEASREVYFISLLYNKFLLGIDYQNIDYARFLKF